MVRASCRFSISPLYHFRQLLDKDAVEDTINSVDPVISSLFLEPFLH